MSEIQKANIDSILAEIPAAASEGAVDWGNPFPLAMDGITVLVLGCGAGRDAFVAGKLVGPNGRVIGVEFSEDLVKKANEIKEEIGANNVEFMQGCHMTLDGLNIKSDSIDLVISNGAVSHALNTQTQLNTIYRVLKFGGEFYMSDIFVDRRTPADVKADADVKAQGLDGALYIEDYRRFCDIAGWPTIRNMCTAIYKKEQPALVKDWTYFVRTMRAYKIPGILEDLCEQYYQYATYKGGIEGADDYYDLDGGHRFVKDEPLSVCGNSCAMVENTRVGKYFEIKGVRGENEVHGGPYPGCGNIPYSAEDVWE